VDVEGPCALCMLVALAKGWDLGSRLGGGQGSGCLCVRKSEGGRKKRAACLEMVQIGYARRHVVAAVLMHVFLTYIWRCCSEDSQVSPPRRICWDHGCTGGENRNHSLHAHCCLCKDIAGHVIPYALTQCLILSWTRFHWLCMAP
jgi:hypothetical protein